MADKGFGVEEINLIGSSGTPTIESPNNLNLDANTVAISTNATIGGWFTSELRTADGYNVGVGTTVPSDPAHISNTTILNAGIVTANYIYGDGSNLTNVIGVGTGVDIQSFDADVGTATTINFGNGLFVDVSTSKGIVTVSSSSSGDNIFSSLGGVYASHSETSHASYNLISAASTSFYEVGILRPNVTPPSDSYFGREVATDADASTIVVGAPFYDTSTSAANIGAVYVFDRIGLEEFNEVGILTGTYNTGQNDYFGESVAVSADGKTIVVGNPGDSPTNSTSGIVYIFDRVGDTFNEVGILTGTYASDNSDRFGSSVAISANGKTIVVGAPGDENPPPSGEESQGLTYVFDRVGDTFNEVGILSAPANGNFVSTFDSYGGSVAISADGKTIIIGAENGDINAATGGYRGIVYLYDRIGDTFEWNSVFYDGTLSNDSHFGEEVAINIDASTIVIGAPRANTYTGAIYVYDRFGTGYEQVGVFTGSLSNTYDRFGSNIAVSADGSTIVVGAEYDELDSNNSSQGLIYVLKRNGDTFNEVGILTHSTSSAADDFGTAVAISADGKTIIGGDDSEEAVYVFDQDVNNTTILTLDSNSGLVIDTDSVSFGSTSLEITYPDTSNLKVSGGDIEISQNYQEINIKDFIVVGDGLQEWYIPGYDNPLDARQLSPQVGTAITSGFSVSSWTRKTDAEVYDWCWDYYDYFDLDRDGVVSHYDIQLHQIAAIRGMHGVVTYNTGSIDEWQDLLDDFAVFRTAYTGPTIPTGRSIVEHLSKWGFQPLGAGTSAVGVTTTVITGVTTGGVNDGTSLDYILSAGIGLTYYSGRLFIGPDDNIEIDTNDGSYQNKITTHYGYNMVACGIATEHLRATVDSNTGEITDIYPYYPSNIAGMGIGYTSLGRSIPVTVVESGHSGTTASIGATVGIGGTLIFTINNGGTGYTNPEFIIPNEKNYRLWDPIGRYKYFTVESGNIAAQGDTVITGIGSTGEIFVDDVVMVDPSITNVIAVGSTGADPNLYARVTQIGTNSVTISKPALGATTGQDFIFSRGIVFYHYPKDPVGYNNFSSGTLQIVGFSTENGGTLYTNELPKRAGHTHYGSFGTYQYFLDSDTKIIGIGQSSVTIDKPTLNHREIPASQSGISAGNGIYPKDIVGRGYFNYGVEGIVLSRVFLKEQYTNNTWLSPSDLSFYESEVWEATTKNPSDGGAAQFRVNKTVGIGTTAISDSDTHTLVVKGTVSIADTTSNAGGARYISTEAPTAAVGADGDIWYDISSTGNVFGTGGNIPVGGIIMWYGTIANIPASWALCDGTSYNTSIGTIVTPDLRDKFVVGATGDTTDTTYPGLSPGATGGDKDAVLIAHSHTYDVTDGTGSSTESNILISFAQSTSTNTTNTTGQDEDQNASTTETGTNKNLPPYYALAYIMRVS